MLRAEYPSTQHDIVLGSVVSACWNATYGTMRELEEAISHAIDTQTDVRDDDEAKAMDPATFGRYVEQYRKFLDVEARLKCR